MNANNTLDEQLSALMDGELDDREASRLIGELQASPALQQAWYAWHLQQDCQAGHPLLSPDFMQQFSARLAAEPVVVAPQRLRRGRPMRKLLVPLTAAASVAFFGVALWQGVYRSATPAAQPMVAAVGQPVAAQAVAQVDVEAVRAYLSAHREAANNPLNGGEPLQTAVFKPAANQ
ncbi:sigma-E factor negative regulatory protein [Chitinilyticum litopenaei]|uniref:sigma-E factor negative regulatory protein n=1 Tax=Chitinilyticum litopenaei TaxID=1121276 RepID=UPI000414192B|nr:sigma-E factor negative regulatory protein [Chitinilyticum litopenaei]